MFDLSISEWILRAIAVIIALTIHEFSHGLISHLQGDKTPESHGRLTLNPLSHIDPLGLIALFVFRFGWAKPTPINSSNYKKQRVGIALTSIAGPLSNLLLSFSAIIFFIITNPDNCSLYYLFMNPDQNAIVFFYQEVIFMNASLALFNMIPVPPLDGSKIFASIFGGRIAELIYKIEGKGTLVIFLLLNLPIVNQTLSKGILSLIQKLFDFGLLLTFKG
jgi:Zn-dependent protease